MNFLQPFGEFITEARRGKRYDLDKFLWIAKNIGSWISRDIFSRVSSSGKINTVAIEKLPYLYKQDFGFQSLPRGESVISFEDWMKNNFISVSMKTYEDKIAAVEEHLEDYLNFINDDQSHDFIAKSKDIFPLVKKEILLYGKPKTDNPTGKYRGRKPGSKNKPKDKFALGPLDKITKREMPSAPQEKVARRTPTWRTSNTMDYEIDELPGGYDKLKYEFKSKS